MRCKPVASCETTGWLSSRSPPADGTRSMSGELIPPPMLISPSVTRQITPAAVSQLSPRAGVCPHANWEIPTMIKDKIFSAPIRVKDGSRTLRLWNCKCMMWWVKFKSLMWHGQIKSALRQWLSLRLPLTSPTRKAVRSTSMLRTMCNNSYNSWNSFVLGHVFIWNFEILSLNS